MSIVFIRRFYHLPARVGGRVIYTGDGPPQRATILSASHGYLWLRFDGETRRRGPFHPAWEITYLPKSETVLD